MREMAAFCGLSEPISKTAPIGGAVIHDKEEKTMATTRSGAIRKLGLDRYRIGVPLLALACTAAVVLALSAPAGALATVRPHATGRSLALAPGSSSIAHASAVAPISLAKITVTDLSTNNGTEYEYDNPAPIYPDDVNCNTGPTDQLCLQFGNGPGSDGGSFMMVPPQSLQGGQAFSATMTVSADNTTCGTGTFSDGDSSATSSIEVDQYVFTPGPNPVQTVAVQFDCTNSSVDISGTIAYNIVPTDPGDGYYVYGQAGEITGFGNDNYLVYLDGAGDYNLNAPIVGMAPTPDGGGYWMVGADGGVFASGDAAFYGSTGSIHLNKPIVGMAATPDGKGYWFVASDGGVFNYGDAGFYGSAGSMHLNKPIVGMAATPDGGGYWLVASDGGIFAYGDAGFYGSTGALHLNKPVVSMAATPDGKGYWFVASDGGIFNYGDAGFYGSAGSLPLVEPVVGMAPAPDGNGYWTVASDGGIFNYGSAGFDGSLGGSGVTDAAGISLGS